MLTLKVLMRFC